MNNRISKIPILNIEYCVIIIFRDLHIIIYIYYINLTLYSLIYLRDSIKSL